jgi:hypothetical protein
MLSEVHTARRRLVARTKWRRRLSGHSEALGGISRISFQMNAASLPHAKLMKAIETIGTRVAPLVRDA